MAHQPAELYARVELQTETDRHTEVMTSLYPPLEADLAKKDGQDGPVCVKGMNNRVLTKKEARKERREGHWMWLYITLARFGLINDW